MIHDERRRKRLRLAWNAAYGEQDTTLAIDGKTLCKAIDAQGNPIPVMSVIDHHTKNCYSQKK